MDAETEESIDRLLLAKTNDWREMAAIAQVSPNEMESTLTFFPARERVELRRLLRAYFSEINEYIAAVKEDGRDFIDIERQLEVYKGFPVLRRGELNYGDKYGK